MWQYLLLSTLDGISLYACTLLNINSNFLIIFRIYIDFDINKIQQHTGVFSINASNSKLKISIFANLLWKFSRFIRQVIVTTKYA